MNNPASSGREHRYDRIHASTRRTSAADDDKLDFKKILPIFVIVLVDLLGLTIIIPLLPLYAAAYGATAFQIGLLGATYPIFQFIGAPIWGVCRPLRPPAGLAGQPGRHPSQPKKRRREQSTGRFYPCPDDSR